MALDVYVMPLGRFKRGDFQTGMERLGKGSGVKVRSVNAKGNANERGVAGKTAEAEIARIKEAVRKANPGVAVEWGDVGETVFEQQCWWEFAGLKAYAKWVDVRDEVREFGEPPGRNWYKHPAYVVPVEGREWTFPAIVDGDFFGGYLLPVDFERRVQVEPWRMRKWTFSRGVGSAPRVLAEVEGVCELLGIGDKAASEVERGDFMGVVRVGAATLRDVCRLACKKGLPVIFSG